MALEEKIIRTEEGLKNIKNDCPRCGSTDIKFNTTLGRLFCNHCKEVFIPKKLDEVETNLDNLNKNIIGSGIKDIDKNFDNIITLKCSCCGAEVIIDTSKKTYAKCHWCRNTLSINERIPNGTIPDAILPFSVTKEEAILEIKKFLSQKTKYMSPEFLKNLNLENVTGVYLPYILVDVNVHCRLVGMGKEYDKKSDTDRYFKITEEFDAIIDDLTIESNVSDTDNIRTINIINSIMPYDTENCIKFESNYLIDYICENRNLNIQDLENKMQKQIKDIIGEYLNRKYNTIIKVKHDEYDINGSQIISVYLPVWIYSYYEKKDSKSIIHYIAVNGRTKEIMGSVPINRKRLIIDFILIEYASFIIGLYICYKYAPSFMYMIMIFICLLFPGFSFYYITHEKYRNEFARHKYEKESKLKIINSLYGDSNIIETTNTDKKYSFKLTIISLFKAVIIQIIVGLILFLLYKVL